jgi:hypothetical protein
MGWLVPYWTLGNHNCYANSIAGELAGRVRKKIPPGKAGGSTC